MKLTEKEIDYELGLHDCGQNPDCTRYRSCGNKVKPIPEKEKLDELKVIFRKKLEKRGYDQKFIDQYIREKWSGN